MFGDILLYFTLTLTFLICSTLLFDIWNIFFCFFFCFVSLQILSNCATSTRTNSPAKHVCIISWVMTPCWITIGPTWRVMPRVWKNLCGKYKVEASNWAKRRWGTACWNGGLPPCLIQFTQVKSLMFAKRSARLLLFCPVSTPSKPYVCKTFAKQGFRHKVVLNCTQKKTHRNEATCLWKVREGFCQKVKIIKIRGNTHRQEAIRLRNLRQGLYKNVIFKKSVCL